MTSHIGTALLLPANEHDARILSAINGNPYVPEMNLEVEVIPHVSEFGNHAVRVTQTLDVQSMYERIEPKRAIGGSFGDGDDCMVYDDWTHEREFFPEPEVVSDEAEPISMFDLIEDKRPSLWSRIKGWLWR